MPEVALRKLTDLKAHPENPRFIRGNNYDLLLKSMREFSDMTSVKPVVINSDNVILGGNMRVRAALELGWAEIPTILAKFKDKAAEREFMIKDNTHYGEFDFDVIANEWNLEPVDEWGVYTYTTDFDPNLNPETESGLVTGADIEKAESHTGNFQNEASEVDVVCPACAHEFKVNRL